MGGVLVLDLAIPSGVVKDVAGNGLAAPCTVDLVIEDDNESPSAPADLRTVAVAPGLVSLTWDAATDNVGVARYLIYRRTHDDLLFSQVGGCGAGRWQLKLHIPGYRRFCRRHLPVLREGPGLGGQPFWPQQRGRSPHRQAGGGCRW